jgi:hypothetical protein
MDDENGDTKIQVNYAWATCIQLLLRSERKCRNTVYEYDRNGLVLYHGRKCVDYLYEQPCDKYVDVSCKHKVDRCRQQSGYTKQG